MLICKDYDFRDLCDMAWSSATYTLMRIQAANKEQEFLDYLENYYYGKIPTQTEVNDYLRFNDDEIFTILNIGGDDADEKEYNEEN